MLTLPCTAPQSSVSSPIESTSAPSNARASPSPPSSPGAGSSSSPTTTSSKKHALPQLLSNPTRRPSIRKRIQSISRASSASLDKATSTLSNAAGSSFSFLRHASSSGLGSAPPTSAGNVPSPSPSPGSGSGSTHVRGASTSSFASGRSSKSFKSTSSSSGQGRARLNVLNIGPPRAFKHQFHLGPDTRTRTSDGPWDESRWRNVFQIRDIDTPVIDVVAGLPRTTSERSLVVVSQPSEITSAAVSSPNLLSITTSSSLNDSSSPASSSPSASQTAATATADEDVTADKAKTPKAVKRASLVKRKPVPPLYPEEASPLPTSPAATSPALTTYVLMPDPMPESTASKVPETTPAIKVSFDIKEIGGDKKDAFPVSSQEDKAETKADEAKSTATADTRKAAPAHVCILHSTPPPALPPRRHTLAHMQARALGRGMGVTTPPRPAATVTPVADAPASEPKPKARPLPIISPSPGSVSVASPTVTTVDMTASEEVQYVVKNVKEGEEEVVADNSPRPSLSSLDSSVSSISACGARSASSGSESGETEEPHTPTDERRVSTSSAHSMSMNLLTKTQLNELGRDVGDADVTIVLPRSSQSYESDLDGDEGDAAATPTRPRPRERVRRVSKRPNPPVRRVEANEESVYVTADEATDVE